MIWPYLVHGCFKCHSAKNVLTHSPALDVFEERDSLQVRDLIMTRI